MPMLRVGNSAFPLVPFLRLQASFGRGSGLIWMSHLVCQGSEAELRDCLFSEWGVHSCNHGEDAGVVCDVPSPPPAPIRLVNGPTPNEGRLEVQFGGNWGTVCDDSWTIENTQVACRQLGYSGAVSFRKKAFYGPGTGTILMDDVKCDGTESRLGACTFFGWTINNCDHNEDVGIKCVVATTASPTTVMLTTAPSPTTDSSTTGPLTTDSLTTGPVSTDSLSTTDSSTTTDYLATTDSLSTTTDSPTSVLQATDSPITSAAAKQITSSEASTTGPTTNKPAPSSPQGQGNDLQPTSAVAEKNPSSGGMPVMPVAIGAVVSVIILIVILVVILMYRKRKNAKAHPAEGSLTTLARYSPRSHAVELNVVLENENNVLQDTPGYMTMKLNAGSNEPVYDVISSNHARARIQREEEENRYAAASDWSKTPVQPPSPKDTVIAVAEVPCGDDDSKEPVYASISARAESKADFAKRLGYDVPKPPVKKGDDDEVQYEVMTALKKPKEM